jgi:hypothetical protein
MSNPDQQPLLSSVSCHSILLTPSPNSPFRARHGQLARPSIDFVAFSPGGRRMLSSTAIRRDSLSPYTPTSSSPETTVVPARSRLSRSKSSTKGGEGSAKPTPSLESGQLYPASHSPSNLQRTGFAPPAPPLQQPTYVHLSFRISQCFRPVRCGFRIHPWRRTEAVRRLSNPQGPMNGGD